MGVAGMIVATLASGYMQARSQKQAYQAAAQQSEANAKQLQQNADKLQETAERQDQANKINEDNQRRIRLARLGQQKAAIGASGVTASGSAANALMDSKEAMEREAAIESYNNRQKVDSIFAQQTDYVNQAEQYKTQAANYRSAGKQAFKNTMLQTAFSLAGNLYSSKSAASQTSSGANMGGIASEFEGGVIPSQNKFWARVGNVNTDWTYKK